MLESRPGSDQLGAVDIDAIVENVDALLLNEH